MTDTAQALTHTAITAKDVFQSVIPLAQAAAFNGSGSWLDSLKYIIAGLAYLVSGPIIMQEITEVIITVFHVPFFAKPYVSHVLSGAVTGVMTWTGVDPTTAIAAGGYLAGFTKLVNSSPIALDLEGKLKAELAKLQGKVPPAGGSLQCSVFALLVGLMVLGATQQAHAGITFGQVSLSPTAAPMVVSVQPFISGSFFKVSGQGVLTDENDALAGMTGLANFGPYNIGIAAAVDRDMTDAITYLAGGVICGVNPYGEVALLWRYGGAVLTYTMPIGVGAQTTP